MDYIQLTLSLNDDLHEYLIAELHDMDFEGFEQEDDILIATIPAKRYDDFKREEIEKRMAALGGQSSILNEKILSPQNWNEEWEQTIKPQVIGRFYVHPTWTTFDQEHDDKIELLIDPKMAFGTGYHATTRLILEWLPEIIKPGDNVLDAGTGTGILAFGALKLGADSAFGFDVDEWSETNARENILLNAIENYEVKLGSTEVIPADEKYDVVLANINRNTLVEILPNLTKHLEKQGKIVLSGLLEEDEEAILNLGSLTDFKHVKTKRLQEWIAILFEA